jgi:hypothetical protein
MGGFGLTNTGGASALVATIPNATLTRLDGKSQTTWVFKLLINGTGGGGTGNVVSKVPVGNNTGWRLRMSAANTLLFELWDVGTTSWVSNSTGANVVYGHWHDLVVVFDGSLVGDAARLKLYLNGQDVTTSVVAGIPATIADDTSLVHLLNDVNLNAATDGRLGLFGLLPDTPLSAADTQSFIEVRSLDQPTVANQPLIHTPGHFGGSEYDFDGAADPNTDHLRTYQVAPLKTQQGTILCWFVPDNMTQFGSLITLTRDGQDDDEFTFAFAGSAANDPMDVFLRLGGATQWQGRSPGGLIAQAPNSVAISSDSSTTRMFINGEQVALANLIGANAGQWLGDALDANVLSLGTARRAVMSNNFNGQEAKVIIRDDCLSPIEIAKLAHSSALGWNRSYGG